MSLLGAEQSRKRQGHFSTLKMVAAQFPFLSHSPLSFILSSSFLCFYLAFIYIHTHTLWATPTGVTYVSRIILYLYGHLEDYMDNYNQQVLIDVSRMAFLFSVWVLWVKLGPAYLISKHVTD